MSARAAMRSATGGSGRRRLDISRRRVLQLGLGATAGLLAGSQQASAQTATPVTTSLSALTAEERGWLERASRSDINGWIHLRIAGAPFERGFQHGYLTAAEYADASASTTAMTYQTTGMDYAFFVEKAAELHKPKITPELTRGDGGDRRGTHRGRRAHDAR